MSVDLSLPLSIVVREATKVAHENVRLSPIAGALFRGQLPREYYVRYLMLLWHIYEYVYGLSTSLHDLIHTASQCDRAWARAA